MSVNAAIGSGGMLLMLVASVFGACSTAFAIRARAYSALRLAPRYAWLGLVGAVVAVVAMQRALITRDFSLAYVQQVGSHTTPTLHNVAAMWSALEGSLLLWVLILAGFTASVAWRFRGRRDDVMVGWALVVMYAVSAFFAFITFGPASPFAAGPPVPVGFDGPGPNPLLQDHLLMLYHPPILYLGYVGWTVPFAFAIAALITGRVGEGWLVETRRVALAAWGFLTIGIILGGWWAYEVLGWGGVWGWDPVENASLLPWLTGTAYLHSVMVQERRGMLRVWNLSLLVATFALTILGTFITRSGIINSVHAFSAGEIDGYLLGFLAAVVVVSLGLIGWRGDRLRAPGAIDSPVSREGAFLANNVVFTVFAFLVLLGTLFPLVVEALEDRRIAVGAPYFDRMTMPLGLTLLFLMGVAPALPWRKASAELLRDRLFWPAWCGLGAAVVAVVLGATGWAPLLAFSLAGFAGGAALRQLVLATRRQGWRGLVGRTNGGMVVHIGVILVAVGLAASNSYTHTATFTVQTGAPYEWAGHTFELVEITETVDERVNVVTAHVRLDGGRVHTPATTTYLRRGDTVPTPSVDTRFAKDVYLTLAGAVRPTPGDNQATLQVDVKPMMAWLWAGTAVIAIGVLLAAFPGRRRRPTDPASAPGRMPTSTTAGGRP